MISQDTPVDLSFDPIRRAIERLDAESLIGFYADDAELMAINRDAPPSRPDVLRGKEKIAEHLRSVCGQDVAVRVAREVVSRDGAAYLLTLEYPNGARLLCATLLQMRGGQIVNELGIQAWDE